VTDEQVFWLLAVLEPLKSLVEALISGAGRLLGVIEALVSVMPITLGRALASDFSE
jgi:hypothetical protein